MLRSALLPLPSSSPPAFSVPCLLQLVPERRWRRKRKRLHTGRLLLRALELRVPVQRQGCVHARGGAELARPSPRRSPPRSSPRAARASGPPPAVTRAELEHAVLPDEPLHRDAEARRRAEASPRTPRCAPPRIRRARSVCAAFYNQGGAGEAGAATAGAGLHAGSSSTTQMRQRGIDTQCIPKVADSGLVPCGTEFDVCEDANPPRGRAVVAPVVHRGRGGSGRRNAG